MIKREHYVNNQKDDKVDDDAAPERSSSRRRDREKSGRQESLDRQRAALSDKLKALFDEVAAEPLPDAFESLLAQLDDEDATEPR